MIQKNVLPVTPTICIIGLGYVGLPLAVEFGKSYTTLGFEINVERVNNLQNGIDTTLEVGEELLKQAKKLTYTCNVGDITIADVYIVTVPTPIKRNNQPNLRPLLDASNTVASILKKNDIVVYESTVYPGATEEECIPILEKVSKLSLNNDFYVGYSPERINPGDKTHRLPNITKITSGSSDKSADFIDFSTIC